MVPAALRALAYAFTAIAAEPLPGDPRLNWDSVADTLLQTPRGAVLLDAAFDAVRLLVLAVRAALTTSQAGSEDVYRLAFHAGAWPGAALQAAQRACALLWLSTQGLWG
jgi:hypothetical protein